MREPNINIPECARCGRPVYVGQPYEVAGRGLFRHRICLVSRHFRPVEQIDG